MHRLHQDEIYGREQSAKDRRITWKREGQQYYLILPERCMIIQKDRITNWIKINRHLRIVFDSLWFEERFDMRQEFHFPRFDHNRRERKNQKSRFQPQD